MLAENNIIRISNDRTVYRRAVIFHDGSFTSKIQFNNARPCWQRETIGEIAEAFIERWREGR